MTKIPAPTNSIASQIYKALESKSSPPRPHLGASLLGHPCDRWLWLTFRWAVIEPFPGRVLRLFRRGQEEEANIVKDLRAIGMDIRATTSNQARVDFGNHVSGSMDGVIFSGVPEAPKTKHLAEFKTASDKKFKEFVDKGLEKANHQYFVQCQVYMQGAGLTRALFLVVNKNDDQIYTERVRYDEAVATKYIKRGHRIVSTERLPEPLSADETWWQCRFCAGHDLCHGGAGTKETNCRTCAHVTIKKDSVYCERHQDSIPTKHQHEACKSHVIHYDLIPSSWKHKRGYGKWSAIYEVNGTELVVGEEGHIYSEILANLDACLDPPEEVMKIREKMSGRIVG